MNGSIGRRRFLGYVVAAPTLVAAAELGLATGASADSERAAAAGSALRLPSPDVTDVLDLNDVMTVAALPTSGLISVQVNADGTVSFALPRAEVGQGITTSSAMLIAEELAVPLDRVRITLADARPELLFNQLTGGSNTTISTYTPIRVAAAIARGRLLAVAAAELGSPVADLTLQAGVVTNRSGASIDLGTLAVKAASSQTQQVSVELTSRESFTVIGKPQNRIDARDAVTGRKRFTMDLAVPGALPTMVCRPPTINGKVGSVANLAAVRAMPGVTDVVVISTGVAVRAATFGQCIDGVRALQVTWKPGTAEGKSDQSVLRELADAELPLGLPPLVPTVEARFTPWSASRTVTVFWLRRAPGNWSGVPY